MIEHLDPHSEVPGFLGEIRRVLVLGGIVRLVAPDLQRRVCRYHETRDADEFVASLGMSDGTPRGILAVAKQVLAGFRNHRWMYDAKSLVRLLELHGFCEVREMPPGETMISNPVPLNLREREDESIYVEARRGGGPGED